MQYQVLPSHVDVAMLRSLLGIFSTVCDGSTFVCRDYALDYSRICYVIEIIFLGTFSGSFLMSGLFSGPFSYFVAALSRP